MTDWFVDDTGEDEFEDDEEVLPDGLASTADAAAPADGGVFASGFTLDELAAKPGRWQELAKELLVAREEREARAEAERLAVLAGAELASDDGADFSSPQLLDGLRAQVKADQESASALYARHRAAQLIEQYGDEAAPGIVAREQAAQAEVDAFLGASDPLYSSQAYLAHERDRAERERAQELGHRSRTLLDDAADAQREIDAVFAAARGGGGS